MKISISRNSIFRYGGNTLSTVLFSIIYGATVFAITTPGLVPANVLWYGQAANIPMIVLGININFFKKIFLYCYIKPMILKFFSFTGKMIQAIANFRQGHTGQLSALTVFLLALGSLGEIFFSYVFYSFQNRMVCP